MPVRPGIMKVKLPKNCVDALVDLWHGVAPGSYHSMRPFEHQLHLVVEGEKIKLVDGLADCHNVDCGLLCYVPVELFCGHGGRGAEVMNVWELGCKFQLLLACVCGDHTLIDSGQLKLTFVGSINFFPGLEKFVFQLR
ncbi:unnamed protein product [Ilex paraguariensis]|uniref:Uncharacterized protein n=1 Tax=Ilex paraguariensis TaxID=185542 RepID=A0ABC8USH2_9AQUA